MRARLPLALRCLAYGALALLALEGAARTEDALRDGAPFFDSYSSESLYRQGPYGREGKPGAHFAKWTMNSMGYRGPEPAKDAVNILTYGASETFGLYESPGEEYPRQLERILDREAGTRYNVVNIALPGVRIGHTDYLEHAIQALHPAWVVVYPSPANYIGVTQPYCGRPAAVSALDGRGSLPSSRLAGKLERLWREKLPAAARDAFNRASIWWYERHGQAMDRVPEATIDAFRADVVCAAQAALHEGARVVVVTHATRFAPGASPDSELLTAWRRFYPELRESGFLDLEARANASLQDLAEKPGVLLVDAARAVPPGPANFADPVHFTDAGAHVVAQLVASAIESAPQTLRR